ncbi:MAG: DUF6291 domain-containing protein [Ruminococcus sp.]
MADKKSFVFYIDNKEVLDLLSDEQLGHLLRLLIEFVETGILQSVDDAYVNMAYRFMTAQIKRDFEKYETVCKRRSEAGKKGGAQKGNKNASKQAKQTNARFANQNEQKQAKQAKQADTVTDTDTDTDTVVSVSKDTDTIEQACTAPEGAAQPAYKREPHEYDPNEPYYKIVPIEEFGDDLV